MTNKLKPIRVNLSVKNTVLLYLSWCWCSANPVPSVLGDLKELNESNMWIWASYLCILYEVSVDCLVTVTASSRSLLISQCKHTSTTTQSRQSDKDEGFRGIPTDLSWRVDATTLFYKNKIKYISTSNIQNVQIPKSTTPEWTLHYWYQHKKHHHPWPSTASSYTRQVTAATWQLLPQYK